MRNRIGKYGFISEGDGSGESTLYLDLVAGLTGATLLSVDRSGLMGVLAGPTGSLMEKITGSLAQCAKYSYYDQTQGTTQLIPEFPSFIAVACDGRRDSISNELSLWNTGTNVFRPIVPNAIYTVRFTGKTGPVGAGGSGGVISVDFALSGSGPPNYNNATFHNRHIQGMEIFTRPNVDQIHIHALYTTFADSALIASGAQIYMSTTVSGGVTLVSSSLFIKEG